MRVSRLSKIAGLGFVGFCAMSIAADKANLSPVLAQAAGFGGAFLGSFVAGLRRRGKGKAAENGISTDPQPTTERNRG